MFHLSVKPISRSAGRSATAAAAYRSGERVVDNRLGEVHDYTRKGGVEYAEIVLPPGAPAWAADRSALWNAAGAAGKRKDARVAREYEVAIPKELSREQGIALVRDFSESLVERYRVAVDFAIHADDARKWDGSEKGFQGFHAHVLTSTRKLGREGFGEKAEPELSDAKRKSLGLGDGASEVERVRELWEVTANRHLEQAEQSQRIDRRSLKAQGIDREPTVHLGPGATLLERSGRATDLGDVNRRIEVAWRRGVEERRELALTEQRIIALDTDIGRALQQRLAVSRSDAQPLSSRPIAAAAPPVSKEIVDSGVADFRAQFEQYQRAEAAKKAREQEALRQKEAARQKALDERLEAERLRQEAEAKRQADLQREAEAKRQAEIARVQSRKGPDMSR